MSVFPHETPVEPESVRMDSQRLANVLRRFQGQQEAGAFPGGQLVVRRNGKLVVNLATGVARGFRPGESPVPVQPHTPFPVLSAGKPLAAVAIAMLEDRGRLDVHAPISEIFPEFAHRGKQHITTLDVLTHTSGILMSEFARKMPLWHDRQAVRQALIDTQPTFPRGTLAYAPHEFGWVLSEIMLCVEGRSLPDFCVEEITTALAIAALRYGLAGRALESLAYSAWLGKSRVMVGGTNVAEGFEDQNSALFFESRNPATSMVSDAASLAAFYDFVLGGGTTPEGHSLIAQETLQRYTTRQHAAIDKSLNLRMAVGRGFVVGTRLPSSFGWWNSTGCFGHAGGFCCLAFGDYRTNLSAAIVTNGNRGPIDLARRFVPLAEGLRRACR